MNRKNYATCRLDHNKKIVPYHAACQPGRRPYDPVQFTYIGDGVVFSVGGKLQSGSTRLSFFTVIKNNGSKA